MLTTPTLVCAAQALARRVFPVPGGPYSRTPIIMNNNNYINNIILKNN